MLGTYMFFNLFENVQYTVMVGRKNCLKYQERQE